MKVSLPKVSRRLGRRSHRDQRSNPEKHTRGHTGWSEFRQHRAFVIGSLLGEPRRMALASWNRSQPTSSSSKHVNGFSKVVLEIPKMLRRMRASER